MQMYFSGLSPRFFSKILFIFGILIFASLPCRAEDEIVGLAKLPTILKSIQARSFTDNITKRKKDTFTLKLPSKKGEVTAKCSPNKDLISDNAIIFNGIMQPLKNLDIHPYRCSVVQITPRLKRSSVKSKAKKNRNKNYFVNFTMHGEKFVSGIMQTSDLYQLKSTDEIIELRSAATVKKNAPEFAILKISKQKLEATLKSCGELDADHALDSIPTTNRSTSKSSAGESVTQSALGGPVKVELALAADYEMQLLVDDPASYMIGTVNGASGWYSNQLGITLVVNAVYLFPSPSLFQTEGAASLQEFANNLPDLGVPVDHAHLFTGRDLYAIGLGDILGSSKLSQVCNPDLKFGQSEVNPLAPSLFAHELGHNVGAPHDNCVGSDYNIYLMCPTLYPGTYLFSDNARNSVAAVVAGAECLKDIASLIPPSNLSAAPTSNTSIQLNWNDNSNDETGFAVEDGTYPLAYFGGTGANITTYNHTGLNSATTYSYRVKSVRNGLFSTGSNLVSATTFARPMHPPTTFQGTLQSGTLKLSWVDRTGDEQGFRLERSGPDNIFSIIGETGPNATSFNDQPPQLGTTYNYRVYAFSGNDRSEAATLTKATVLTAPQGIPHLSYESESSTSIRLFWQNTDGPNIVQSYKIFRKDGPNIAYIQVGEVGPLVNSFLDSNLQFNKVYYYDVRAFNSVGNSDTETLYVRTGLAIPADFTVSSVNSNSIKLDWRDRNGFGEIIIRATKGYCPTDGGGIILPLIIRVPFNSPFIHTPLDPDTDYCYSISAYYNNQSTDPTPWKKARTGSLPTPKPTLKAPPPTPTYTPTATATPTRTPTPVAIPGYLNLVPVLGSVELNWYNPNVGYVGIERKAGNNPFSQIASVAGGVYQYHDNTLTQPATYTYRIFNEVNGVRGYTNEKSITISNNDAIPMPGLFMAKADVNAVFTTWRDNSLNEAGWVVERSEPGQSFAIISGVLPKNTTSYLDTNIISGVTYSYRTRAVGYGNASIYSNTSNVKVVFRQFPWQNPINRLDVNNDGRVSKVDFEILRDALLAGKAGPLPVPNADFRPPPFYDVNGDGSLSPVDAAMVSAQNPLPD